MGGGDGKEKRFAEGAERGGGEWIEILMKVEMGMVGPVCTGLARVGCGVYNGGLGWLAIWGHVWTSAGRVSVLARPTR